jgi:hypothetical protein
MSGSTRGAAGGHDQQQQHQAVHATVVEVVVGERDLVSEAAGSENELAGDHGDEGISDGELDAGEQVRRRSRQLEPPCRLDRAHAMDARHLGEDSGNAVESVQSGDDHRHGARRHPDQDHRQQREAEDRHHDGIEDEDRHGIIGGEERIQHPSHARHRVNQESEQEAEHHRENDGNRHHAEGALQMTVDLPRS